MRIETNSFYSSPQTSIETMESTSIEKKNNNSILGSPNLDVNTKKTTNEQEVIKKIEQANKHFKTFDRKLEFSIHEKTKEIIVKVINTENDSVVREIPSEKILDMIAKLWEMTGMFVDEKR